MKRILICEDEKVSQESLKNLLVKRNYEVFGADNGQEAITKAKELNPDLIMLDIRMPKIDGIEVAREVRQFAKNTKIIFITAFASPELQKEALKYNISNYFIKPVTFDAILQSVEEALK